MRIISSGSYYLFVLSFCSFGGRNLSRKDIQVIAGSGCPSLDRKVVNSGKRLRALVGIDEGTVCAQFFVNF